MRPTLLVPFLSLFCALLVACGTDPRAAMNTRITADHEQLEKDHLLLKQRADSLVVQYTNWEQEMTGGDESKHIPGLERTSVRVSDLQAIVQDDERFITEMAQAGKEFADGQGNEIEFTQHYEEMMQGHAQMVEQFWKIAEEAKFKLDEQL